MSQAETVSRLRRLADDWRKEEKQLCEQFGNEIIPHSMRAQKIKDTKAIDAAVEMIERGEQETAAQRAKVERMTKRLRTILEEPKENMSDSKALREMVRQARLALEESK